MQTQEASSFGQALRFWRKRRGLTQLDLSHEANISPRHISFIESGKSQPSPGTVIKLVDTLNLPPLRRKELLEFAGITGDYVETLPTGIPSTAIRRAAQTFMDRCEPYPAMILDAYKNVIQANRVFSVFFNGTFFPVVHFDGKINIPLTMANTSGLSDCMENWEQLFSQLVLSIKYNALQHPEDAKLNRLHQCLENHQQAQSILRHCLDNSRLDGELSRITVTFGDLSIDFSLTLTQLWDDADSEKPVKFEIYSIMPIGEASVSLANSLLQAHFVELAS